MIQVKTINVTCRAPFAVSNEPKLSFTNTSQYFTHTSKEDWQHNYRQANVLRRKVVGHRRRVNSQNKYNLVNPDKQDPMFFYPMPAARKPRPFRKMLIEKELAEIRNKEVKMMEDFGINFG